MKMKTKTSTARKSQRIYRDRTRPAQRSLLSFWLPPHSVAEGMFFYESKYQKNPLAWSEKISYNEEELIPLHSPEEGEEADETPRAQRTSMDITPGSAPPAGERSHELESPALDSEAGAGATTQTMGTSAGIPADQQRPSVTADSRALQATEPKTSVPEATGPAASVSAPHQLPDPQPPASDDAAGVTTSAAKRKHETADAQTQTKRVKGMLKNQTTQTPANWSQATQTSPAATGKKQKGTQTTLTSTKTSLLLVPFYQGHGKDFKNRTLFDTILKWNDDALERTHDYIQVLFPLPEPSAHNRNAPLLDRDIVLAFRSQAKLRENLRLAFIRMLTFFGFQLVTKQNQQQQQKQPLSISRRPNFDQIASRWLRNRNHNHQRMTRIIRSLRILGLRDEAVAFFAALTKVRDDYAGVLGPESWRHWRMAAESELVRPGPAREWLAEMDQLDLLTGGDDGGAATTGGNAAAADGDGNAAAAPDGPDA